MNTPTSPFEEIHGGTPPQETGRYLVVFRDGANNEGIAALESVGLNLVVSDRLDERPMTEERAGDASAMVLSTVGVAITESNQDQLAALRSVERDPNGPILSIQPERIRHGIGGTQPRWPADVGFLGPLPGNRERFEDELKFTDRMPSNTVFDETQFTWGLQVTGVHKSNASGAGIRIAILDTGLDFNSDDAGNIVPHSDFVSRRIKAESFVRGAPRDQNGHGTHCLGVACGPREPATKSPRYGIAHDAEIFVGKVLYDDATGVDGVVIAGINWAIDAGCQIISMSFAREKRPDEPFNTAYETVARRALAAGVLLVAAAGQESGRPDLIKPVSGPADCPSIMAVAALDMDLAVWRLCNGGVKPSGGEIDLAAPGISIDSSWLTPTNRYRKSGTSPATAFVAGIAALYAEMDPTARGRALWDVLLRQAKKLQLLPTDVGAGLVQAPQQTDTQDFQRRTMTTASRSKNPDRLDNSSITLGPPDDDPGIKGVEGSPIIIGGGSVNIDFNQAHYTPIAGSSGSFSHATDSIDTILVVDADRILTSNLLGAVRGKNCTVTIRTRIGTAAPSNIVIRSRPGGPMTLTFDPSQFRAHPTDPRRPFFSDERKLTENIEVFDNDTGLTTSVAIPTLGNCQITIVDVLPLL